MVRKVSNNMNNELYMIQYNRKKSKRFGWECDMVEYINQKTCQNTLIRFNRNALTRRERFKLLLCKHKRFAILYLFKIKIGLQRKILCQHK